MESLDFYGGQFGGQLPPLGRPVLISPKKRGQAYVILEQIGGEGDRQVRTYRTLTAFNAPFRLRTYMDVTAEREPVLDAVFLAPRRRP